MSVEDLVNRLMDEQDDKHRLLRELGQSSEILEDGTYIQERLIYSESPDGGEETLP